MPWVLDMTSAILVVGASGNVGREVCAFLEVAGVAYLKTTRHHNQVASDTRFLDFYAPESFAAAFKGIQTLFFVRPPAISQVERYIQPFLATAGESGVEQVIFLSVIGVENLPFIPHAKIENLIIEMGFRYSFLRASFFMQNFSSQHRAEIQQDNRIYIPAGKARVSFIDVQDIGAVAARLLRDFPAENTQLDLTGPESLNFQEIAKIFTEILGRKIDYLSPNLISFFLYRQQLGDAVAQILVMIMLYTITRFVDNSPP